MKSKRKEAPWDARIKALVRNHGSPEAVAVEIGVSYPSIVRWTKGWKPSRLAQSRIVELEKKDALLESRKKLGEVKP